MRSRAFLLEPRCQVCLRERLDIRFRADRGVNRGVIVQANKKVETFLIILKTKTNTNEL